MHCHFFKICAACCWVCFTVTQGLRECYFPLLLLYIYIHSMYTLYLLKILVKYYYTLYMLLYLNNEFSFNSC